MCRNRTKEPLKANCCEVGETCQGDCQIVEKMKWKTKFLVTHTDLKMEYFKGEFCLSLGFVL